LYGDTIKTAKWRLLGSEIPVNFTIPPALLQLLGKLTGKSSAVERLLDSLTVSNNKIVTTLNWQPPYTVEQGLAATAKWYKSVNSWK
jgi:nucleoside-diphosphate-sugar epimerase